MRVSVKFVLGSLLHPSAFLKSVAFIVVSPESVFMLSCLTRFVDVYVFMLISCIPAIAPAFAISSSRILRSQTEYGDRSQLDSTDLRYGCPLLNTSSGF